MFRRLLLAFAVLLLLRLPAESVENFSDLLSKCEQLVRTANLSGNQITFNNDTGSHACWAYFGAVQNLIGVRFDDKPALYVCAPTTGTRYELIRVFVSFAQQNPSKLSQSNVNVVLQALMSAYPCSAQ